MTAKKWNLSGENLTINADEIGVSGSSVKFETHSMGLSQGVQTIDVTFGNVRAIIVASRGMNVWKAWAGEQEFGWQSPVDGPVHPAFVPLMEPSGLGWLDGFDELFVRCGLESNGAPEHDSETNQLIYPLHGKIGNKPAKDLTVEVDGEKLIVTGTVFETRFHFFKMRLIAKTIFNAQSQKIEFEDTVVNLSDSPSEFQMLYHINFGEPILDAGSRFVAPMKEVVPRNEHAAKSIDGWENYPAPQAGIEEQVYFMKLFGDKDGNTETLLKNAHGMAGAALSFNINQLPVYTIWKNPTSLADGYVTGLEPGTNFPNPRSYEGEQGRVIKLDGGKQTTLKVGMELLTTEKAIADSEARIKSLQGDEETKVWDTPQKGWCSDA